jgi:hypothetical protein
LRRGRDPPAEYRTANLAIRLPTAKLGIPAAAASLTSIKWLIATLVSVALAATLLRLSTDQDRWVHAETIVRGARIVSYSLDADAAVSGWLRNSLPTLKVVCTEQQGIELFVVTGLPAVVEAGDRRSVRLQFDDQKPVITTWVQSENRQALLAPSDEARALVERLAESRRFRFAFVPFNAEPAVARFTLRGFDAHWRAMRVACDSYAAH